MNRSNIPPNIQCPAPSAVVTMLGSVPDCPGFELDLFPKQGASGKHRLLPRHWRLIQAETLQVELELRSNYTMPIYSVGSGIDGDISLKKT